MFCLYDKAVIFTLFIATSFLFTGVSTPLLHLSMINHQLMPGKMYSESDISGTASRVSEIDRYHNYAVRSIDIFGESTEGGEIYHYLKDDVVQKMSLELYGETGRLYYDFYFWNDELIHVYKLITNYNTHFLDDTFDDSKTTEQENKYYFKGGEMIKAIEDGHELGIAEDTYGEIGETLFQDAQRYRAMEF